MSEHSLESLAKRVEALEKALGLAALSDKRLWRDFPGMSGDREIQRQIDEEGRKIREAEQGRIPVGPVANPLAAKTEKNKAVTGKLTGTGTKPGSVLIFFAGAVTPSRGKDSVSSNGSFTYIPNNGFSGTDGFSFTVNEGMIGSRPALVTVKVGTVKNPAPLAVNGEDVTDQDVEYHGTLQNLAGDTEGDSLTFAVVDEPVHGTVDLNPAGDFVYRPEAGFNGLDSFTFKANGGLTSSNVATFSLAVGEASGEYKLKLSSSTGVIGTSTKTVVPLDPRAKLVNIDAAATLAVPSITVNITKNRDKHDKIVITKGLGNGLNVAVKGSKIYVDKELVAVTGKTDDGFGLMINFESDVDVTTLNAVLQRISLKTTKAASSKTRTVTLLVETDDDLSSSGTIKAEKA